MSDLALIFDFGNVVAFFDYTKACARFGSQLGLTGEAIRQRLMESGFPHLLVEFESGQMEPEEFARNVMKLALVDFSYQEFVDHWQDIFSLNDSVAKLIEQLDATGYRLLLGSNTNILHSNHFRRQFASTIDRFDHLVLSHEVGYMKPRPEFYAACAAAAGLPPGSCVFIDDLPENVDGARRAGLLALHYVDTPTLAADLARLGVDISTSAY